MYSATSCTDECPKICAHILWSQALAVNTSAIIGQLEKAANNSLVFLILLSIRHLKLKTPNQNPNFDLMAELKMGVLLGGGGIFCGNVGYVQLDSAEERRIYL